MSAIVIFSGAYLLVLNKESIENNVGEQCSQGRGYILSLCIIVLAGLLLRLWNLTILDPYIDEYNHLLAAQQYLANGEFEYQRAKLVTYFVSIFYWIGNASSFYEYLFWGRIPGAIFGALTAIPIYFLARRISHQVGIASAVLWTLSPWTIGVSRTIREYAFYPFFILLITLLLIKLIELATEYRRRDTTILALAPYALAIIMFIGFTFFIDNLSTLKVGLLVLASVFFYYVVLNVSRLRHDFAQVEKQVFILIILLTFFSCFLIYIAISSNNVSFGASNLSKKWFDVFMNSLITSPIHWWHGSSLLIETYFFTGAVLIYAILTQKKDYFMNLLIFTALTVFFMYFFNRYFRPRYFFYAMPFFSIIIASGIYSFYLMITSALRDKVARFLPACLVILFVASLSNPLNILYPLISNKHDLVFTTGEYHYKVSNIMAFLKDNIQPGAYFVSTIFTNILQLSFSINKNNIHAFDAHDSERFKKVINFIKDKKGGFLILDHLRMEYGPRDILKIQTFLLEIPKLTLFTNRMVYRHTVGTGD